MAGGFWRPRQALQRSRAPADAEKADEVGRDVGQFSFSGEGAGEGNPRLIDFFEGLLGRSLGRPLGLAALVQLFL